MDYKNLIETTIREVGFDQVFECNVSDVDDNVIAIVTPQPGLLFYVQKQDAEFVGVRVNVNADPGYVLAVIIGLVHKGIRFIELGVFNIVPTDIPGKFEIIVDPEEAYGLTQSKE